MTAQKTNLQLVTEFVTSHPGLQATDLAKAISESTGGKKTVAAMNNAISTFISKGFLYRDDQRCVFAFKPTEPLKLEKPPKEKYLDRIVAFLTHAGPSTIEMIADGTKISGNCVIQSIETAPHVTFLREKDRYSVQG